MVKRTKRILVLVMTLALCLGSVIMHGGEALVVDSGAITAYASSNLTGVSMPTGKTLYIYYNNDIQWRWNINNLGTAKGDCVHLDDKDGKNCTMVLESAGSENGASYYGIKYTKSGYYIDSEGDNDQTEEVLHQYKKSLGQDNQKFRFVPVSGKEDVYYILSKKGDNSGKSLYIGLKKAAGKHVQLVTSDTPVEWYISEADLTSVVSLKGTEKKFDKESGLIATFTPENFLCDLNVQSPEVTVNGSDLHLFYIGTASKFELVWSSQFNGYYICQRELDESEIDLNKGKVWDIEGMSKEKALIHLWSKQDQHPSQIWRFIPKGDNLYEIYNAFSGLYLNLKENADKEGVKIYQSSTPMTWEVNLLNQVNQNTESANWMKNLPDSKPLSTVNMPGSHDTGATKMFCEDGVSETWSVTECQQLYPDEQMNMGVRAFDIRCSTWRNETKNGVNDPIIVHGNYITKCLNRDGSNMKLSDIMEDAKTFLQAHPTETIIMTIKADGDLGSHGNVAEAVAQYIQDKNYPLWREDRIPTVGEARGKVILLRRYTFDDYSLPDGVAEWEFGLDLSNWDDHEYKTFKNAVPIYWEEKIDKSNKTILANFVHVQDYYKAESETEKAEYFFGTIDHADLNKITYVVNNGLFYEGVGKCTRTQMSYLFNYATSKDTIGRARSTNLIIMNDTEYVLPGRSVGIAMFNYVDWKTAEKIWKTNFSNTQSAVQQTLTSEQHGITIDGKIDSGAKLKIEVLDDTSNEYMTLKDAIKSGKVLHGFRIVLVKEDGTESSWEGELSVTIKKELQEKLKQLGIYYVDNESNSHMLDLTSNDETITFNTDKLGYFVMVSNDEESQISPSDTDNDDKVNDNNKNDVSPVQTGDTSNILLYLIISAMAGAVLIRECKALRRN